MKRSRGKRGTLIVAALMLFVLVVSLGLGLMSSQRARMRAAQSQLGAVQAKALALSAWDDVRAKLGKDFFFPPQVEGQPFFSYGEDVYDESGELYGSYSVVVDSRFVIHKRDEGTDTVADSMANEYFGYYLITCVGKVGARDEAPSAERSLYFEVDARTFRVLRAQDRESL